MSVNVDDAAFRQELRVLPYDKRWNLLRPKLESLFRTTEVEHICRIMKERWAFVATPTQCKYRFKSWGWKKSIPETVKRDICAKAVDRAAHGKDTIALYNGQPVLPGRLQRTKKVTTNQQLSISTMLSLPTDNYNIIGGYVPFGNSLLVNWRMPYGSHPTDPALIWTSSSSTSSIQTPSDVDVQTPARTDGSSPPNLPHDPVEASLMPVVRHQRSIMLLEGRLPELLRILSQAEQMVLSTWLYQNWYSAFVAAQSWDRYPLLRSHEIRRQEPQNFLGASSAVINLNDGFDPHTHLHGSEICSPSHECLWAVHISPDTYDEMFGFNSHMDNENSDYNPGTENDSGQQFISYLHEGLRSNKLSGIPEHRLPLPVPELARQTPQHPSDGILESVALAIMGRNRSLLVDVLRIAVRENVDIASIYPFHMAAAFLDGGEQCCELFKLLTEKVSGAAVTKERLTNEYGHTVLDSLLITILRSHSTVQMKDVDRTLSESAVMPGQEVDVCGRWSADSPCFRALVASGGTTIPASWKHKFCHTSVQAVVHSTSKLLQSFPTMLDLPSGLFMLTCFDCGLRLQMGPLHALVMTAFHHVTSGLPGEDLFGIVACYLSLVSRSVPLLTKCEISSSQLFHLSSRVACNHEPMTPYETAIKVQDELKKYNLPDSVWTGWLVFAGIMKVAEESFAASELTREEYNAMYEATESEMEDPDLDVWTSTRTGHENGDSDDADLLYPQYSRDCDEEGCIHIYNSETPQFGDSHILGHVWAAVQAELADYRRINMDHGWLSESFSMKALLESLQRNVMPEVGHVRHDQLKPYCRCGNFEDIYGWIARHEDIFKAHCGYDFLKLGEGRCRFLVPMF